MRFSSRPWPVLVLLGLLLFLSSAPVLAQQEKRDREETVLEEMVITGTRSERAVEDVVAEVKVLTRDELALEAVTTWDDALKYATGIKVERPDGIGHAIPMSLHIRGISGSRQNLILLDGYPLNEPETGFITMYTVPAEMIRRIEVVKGPYSSLYGSYAMGGVVNLISSRAESEEWAVTALGRLGNFGYWDLGLRAAKDFGGVDVSFGYKHREAGNYLRRERESRRVFDPGTGLTEVREFEVENRSLRAEFADLRVGWEINPENELHLTAVLMDDRQESGVATYLPDLDPYSKDTNLHLSLRTIHRLPAGYTLNLAAYTNANWGEGLREEMDMSSPGKARYYPEEKNSLGLELGFQVQLAKSLAEWNMLTVGVDTNRNYVSWDRADRESGKQVVDESASLYNIAPYLQLEMFFLNGDLIITPGLRGDFHSETESSISPKLALRYNIDEFWSVRASGGRSFRAPSVNELHGPAWMMIPGIPFLSNPDLDPEYLWTTDLGIEFDYRGRYKLGLSGFYTKGYDFIEALISMGVQQYANIDEVEIFGLETEADLQLTDWLKVFANYAYIHARDLGTGNPLADQPVHSFKAGLLLRKRFGSFTLGANLSGTFEFSRPHWVGMGSSGELLYDDTTLVDAGLTLEHTSGWSLGLKGTNIFDTAWFSHGTSPGAGRAVWLEASYKFCP